MGPCVSAYSNTRLPARAFPGVTALAYWDDLYIYSRTSQGIYYGIEGVAPSRTLIFEFYTSRFKSPSDYYQFQARFFEASPNVVQYVYFSASDEGSSCTIGAQGRIAGGKFTLPSNIFVIRVLASKGGPYIQYSFNAAGSVSTGLSVTLDTVAGTFTTNSSSMILDEIG